MFGSVSIWELLIVGGLIIVLFGSKKLPLLGEGLGKGIRNFKSAISGGDEKKVENSSNENQS